MHGGPVRSGAAIGVMLAAVVVACSGAPVVPTQPPVTGPAVTESPIPTRGPLVIEDAGLEVDLAPGSYVSRLFKPTLRLELGRGWFRRDSTSERKVNLRIGPNGERDVTFISGVDSLKCGTDPVVDAPTAAAIVMAVTGAPNLRVTSRRDVPVAGRTGIELRLAADPDAVPPEDPTRLPEIGCVLTIGEPFPGGAWVEVTAVMDLQLVVLDVEGTTILIRGRPAADPEAHYDAVLGLIAAMALG